MAIGNITVATEHFPSAQSYSFAFPVNPTTGSLITLHSSRFRGSDTNAYFATSLTKTGGTATISTPILHHQGTASTNNTTRYGLWSFLVTAGGTLTMQVEHFTTAGVGSVFAAEFSGNWTEGRGGLANFTPSLISGTAVDSGNASSLGPALFVGSMLTNAGGAVTTTEDGAWTLIGEQEASGQTNAGSIYRIVSGPTTDSASWTLGTSSQYSACICVFREGRQFPARMIL